VSRVKWKYMSSCLCVKRVENRIVEYGWIGKRAAVENLTDRAHFVANILPFFTKFVIDNADSWFVVQKPVLENPDWSELVYFRSGGIVKLESYIVICEDIIHVTGSSIQ